MFNSNTTGSVDWPSVIQKMRELEAEMQQYPTELVVLASTWRKVKEKIAVPERASNQDLAFQQMFHGMQVHERGTVRECLDVLVELEEAGRRPALVMDGDVPTDCLGHPWFVEQAKKFYERFKPPLQFERFSSDEPIRWKPRPHFSR